MKLSVVCTSSILLLALMFPASAQRKSDVASVPFSPAPYRVGERLTFNVSFSNIISAAHVEIQVVARGMFFGRDGLRLRGHVETTGMVNAALFAINNDYNTYVDPETGLPFRAQQVLREATHTSETSNDLNQPSAVATMTSKPGSGESSGAYDFLSAIYRLRALPLNEGSAYYFTVRSEKEDYQAEVRVIGRQAVKTSVGSFNTIVCQVRVKNNSQANRFNISIYFSDDERHVPVLITARLSAGEIRTELVGSDFVVPSAPNPSPTPLNIEPVSELPPPRPVSATANSLEGFPFKVGEQLNYQIFLGNMGQPAGTATYQVRARSHYFDHDGLLFTLKAQTTSVLQRTFFANDQISSYVDPKTLLPFRTELNLTEGRRHVSQTLTVNQDYGAATTSDGVKIDIPVGTHDYLSFFYTLRTFGMVPPKRNAVSILVDNKPKTLFISALKRETIQLGSQKISAIQVSLTTDDPESDKFALRAWISDDQRRLPLRIVATTELGQVRADLAILPVTRQ